MSEVTGSGTRRSAVTIGNQLVRSCSRKRSNPFYFPVVKTVCQHGVFVNHIVHHNNCGILPGQVILIDPMTLFYPVKCMDNAMFWHNWCTETIETLPTLSECHIGDIAETSQLTKWWQR